MQFLFFETHTTQMSKKRRYCKLTRTLSDDEWSHVLSYLCTSDNAWTSAMDVARASRVCRSFKAMNPWQHWTKAFHVFAFPQGFPSVLSSFMESAKEEGGLVTQKSAMNHVKLSAQSLKHVPHTTIRLKYNRLKYLYKIEDVLQVATAKYACLAAFEEHVVKCKARVATREKNKALKQARREEVNTMFQDMGAAFMIFRSYSVIETYVDKDQGSLESIRILALEKKKVYDAQQAHARLIEKRRADYGAWVQELQLSQKMYLNNPVVIRFIQHGIGTKDEVVQAVQAHQERLDLYQQQAPARQDELVAELKEHGLKLRSDSTFCRQYIRQETTASLQEVVATMKMTSFLFSKGHRKWSRWHRILENAMRNRIRSGATQCWYAACEYVMETNETSIDHDHDDDSDSDYYG